MTELTERLNRFETRLHVMERELAALRLLATEEVPGTSEEARAATPEPEPAFVWTKPAAVLPQRVRREIDWSFLFGARALAWTGGAVMLLGIVFFFVLAVDRGWIGPVARVSLGAAASALSIAAAYAVRRRVGDTYASVSGAGVGIAGLYATLLAATALYDLVPRPLALAAAAGIAACGAALAVAWRSQTLASLGLLGAVLVPVPIALQDGHVSPVGTTFAVLVLAATVLVAVPRAWHALYVTTTAVALLEGTALAVAHHPSATGVTAALWLVTAGGALWLALRDRMTYLPASMLVVSAVFAGWMAAVLYDGTARGLILLAIAGFYGGASLALWRRDRNAAAVLWAIGLTVAAVAAAVLVSGVTLTVVWAAEAAVLARLARRLDEPRFQLASLAWLGLAFAHGLGVDAPLSKLFVASDDTWTAALGAGALATGTALVALSTFEWSRREEGVLAQLFDDLRGSQPAIRAGGVVLAAVVALYGASLFVVTVPESWSTGHVAVATLWAALAVALALAGRRVASLALLVGSMLLVVAYDLHWVDAPQRWWSFGAVAAAAIVVAVVHQVDEEAYLGLAISACLAAASVAGLLDGKPMGTGLLALGAGYGALAVAVRGRRRNFATALGGVALVLAVPASIVLLDGTWLVLAWSATAIALALLARHEERLLYGALSYFGLALAHVLALDAQPSDLFVAHRHPGGGVPAVLLVTAAGAAIAWRSELLREAMTWIAGTLGLYALTLAILELFEDTGHDVDTAFQRGHTAVSAVWGIVGLSLLVAGLKRGGRSLRIGGFALFGAALAKLFLYDLANLSSIARALSFLAVGALILTGAFFYQRLAAEPHVDSAA